MRKRFGRNDIILISVIVMISVALLLIWKLVYLKGQDTDSDACVEVTIDGRAYGTYPLSKDDTIEIKNGDGDVTNTLVIKGGVADMTSADCPDHLCVKKKAKSSNEGIGYKSYLGMLLFTKSMKNIAYRSMDVQEATVRMTGAHESFRMDNAICELSTDVSYKYHGIFLCFVNLLDGADNEYTIKNKAKYSYYGR